MISSMTEELQTYLDSLARNERYRVVRCLKASAAETTEVVYVDENATLTGPFIRKRFPLEGPGIEAYERLQQAQASGWQPAHLPRVYEVFPTDNERIVLMEYVEGQTLAQVVDQAGPSLTLAERYFPALCEGVTELHEGTGAPLVHRDLKPSNIIIGPRGLTIIDFGITRLYKPDAIQDTEHFGTRSYAPPEQYGFGQTNERSDVYALGILLYYLLRGQEPAQFLVSNRFEGDGLPPAVQQVLAKATAFDPAQRYGSARELKAAASQALAASAQPAAGGVYDVAGGSHAFAKGVQASAEEVPPSSGKKMRRPWCLRNLVVLACWLIFAAACWQLIFAPEGEWVEIPLWYRVGIYGAGFLLGLTGICYGLLDRQALGSFIPPLRRQTKQAGRKAALTIAALGFGIFFLLIFLSALGVIPYSIPSYSS